MSDKKIPCRVQINGKWYNVREGWAGTLNLSESMSSVTYTAKEPYMHINNLYFVYDANGNKVGEFHTVNRSYSGDVSNFEM